MSGIIEDKDALIADLKARVDELEAALGEIDDYAHDNSTGPAVPDALWHVRDMARRPFETVAANRERVGREVRAALSWESIQAGEYRK